MALVGLFARQTIMLALWTLVLKQKSGFTLAALGLRISVVSVLPTLTTKQSNAPIHPVGVIAMKLTNVLLIAAVALLAIIAYVNYKSSLKDCPANRALSSEELARKANGERITEKGWC
jgi:hypothetical protein